MKKKKMFLLAILATVVLYSLGIFTGYFIQKDVLTKTEEDLQKVQEEFKTYKQNLETIQLEQLYLSTYQGESSCSFLISIINEMQKNLSYFWSKLPSKLEVYEKYSQVQPEYLELKRDYTMISIRAWLLSLNVKEKCGENIVPILYFYSKDCDRCIEQGNVLDEVRAEDKRVAVFTIDLNLNESIVKVIKEAHDISQAPSLLIEKNTSIQGFVSKDQLNQAISELVS
jgi:uncharacterized membrane-anchored protein YhcB (DUF1043 family)